MARKKAAKKPRTRRPARPTLQQQRSGKLAFGVLVLMTLLIEEQVRRDLPRIQRMLDKKYPQGKGLPRPPRTK